MYNARATCPNASKAESNSQSNLSLPSGQTTLVSHHGTRLRGFPDGGVDLT